MSFAAPLPVLPSRDARDELPKALKRFRAEGIAAEPLVFGSHRKPEGVVIPFELYEELLPLVEDILSLAPPESGSPPGPPYRCPTSPHGSASIWIPSTRDRPAQPDRAAGLRG